MKIDLSKTSTNKIIVICAAIIVIILFGNFALSIAGVTVSTTENKNNWYKLIIYTGKNFDERYKLSDNLEKEQHIILEAKFTEMRDLFLNTHRQLLATKGIIDNVFSHPQYKAYSHIIEIGFNRMRYLALQDFQEMKIKFTRPENKKFEYNFIKKEFEAYLGYVYPDGAMTGLVGELIVSFGKIVQDEWVNIGIVTAEENYNWTRQIVGKTSELIKDVYIESVKKQLYYDEQINNKEIELQEYVESL